MAALVRVIAHRCWDQIIGDYGHQPAMSRQLGSIPPQTAQPGRVGRPGMMLTNAIRIRAKRMPTLFKPARANLWAALVVPRADRFPGRAAATLGVSMRNRHRPAWPGLRQPG